MSSHHASQDGKYNVPNWTYFDCNTFGVSLPPTPPNVHVVKFKFRRTSDCRDILNHRPGMPFVESQVDSLKVC